MNKEVIYDSSADINYWFPGDPKPETTVKLPEVQIIPVEAEIEPEAA